MVVCRQSLWVIFRRKRFGALILNLLSFSVSRTCLRHTLILHWQSGEKEPWFLATNLLHPQSTLRLYRLRMWIEEMFADLKKHGFDLEYTHLQHFLRLSRFTLVVCLLYLLSVFRLGCDFLEDCWRLFDPIPIVAIPNICTVSGR